MRITNQMLARTAERTGIPLQQNSLLDIMNKKSPSVGNPFSSVGGSSQTTQTNPYLQNQYAKNNKKLQDAAKSLSEYASKLNEEGENSLFGKAEASGDTSDLTAVITGMVDAYNKTAKGLKGSGSTLDMFYAQELKNYISDNSAALKAVGVIRNNDGSLTIQKDVLDKADVESLKKAFGSASGFSEKVGYVSGRVAENAAASSGNIFSGYDKNGTDFFQAFTKNMYDFWG